MDIYCDTCKRYLSECVADPRSKCGLRREVERLTAQVHDLTSRLTDSVLGRKKVEREVERLTKERDAAYAAHAQSDERHAETVRAVRARAEKAEAERDEARAQVERLRGALRECVHVHNGTHSEDCHAFGAGSDEDLDPEATSPDPHCDCGATAKRESFRAALADAAVRNDDPDAPDERR